MGDKIDIMIITCTTIESGEQIIRVDSQMPHAMAVGLLYLAIQESLRQSTTISESLARRITSRTSNQKNEDINAE